MLRAGLTSIGSPMRIADADRRVIEQYRNAVGAYEITGMHSGNGVIESLAVSGFAMPTNAAFDSEALARAASAQFARA